MTLRPNNSTGGSKTFDEYTPEEIASHIKETTTIQRDRAMFRQPMDNAAIAKCMELAKKINDPGLINTVQSTADYVKANAPAAVRN